MPTNAPYLVGKMLKHGIDMQVLRQPFQKTAFVQDVRMTVGELDEGHFFGSHSPRL